MCTVDRNVLSTDTFPMAAEFTYQHAGIYNDCFVIVHLYSVYGRVTNNKHLAVAILLSTELFWRKEGGREEREYSTTFLKQLFLSLSVVDKPPHQICISIKYNYYCRYLNI